MRWRACALPCSTTPATCRTPGSSTAASPPSSRQSAADRETRRAAFLQDFVAEARSSGLVQTLIDRHGVTGKLQVPSG